MQHGEMESSVQQLPFDSMEARAAVEQAAAMAAHLAKSEACEFQASHRAPHNNTAPAIAVGTPCLPAGCVMGVPVVTGTPAVALPTGKELFKVAMSFVEWDDYHGILELVRRGGNAIDLNRKCGFSVALRPEAGSVGDEFPHQLRVSGASLLHYAICIGSFRAATALLIVSPALLRSTCKVLSEQDAHRASGEWWTASEVARIFCVLYSENGDDCQEDVNSTATMYNSALPVLEQGEQDPAKLPFLHLPNAGQRIVAAGCDCDAAMAALFTAAGQHADTAMSD